MTGKGLIIVNTGYGEEKTTTALGMLLQAWEQCIHVCVIQFLKDENWESGEIRAARRLGVE